MQFTRAALIVYDVTPTSRPLSRSADALPPHLPPPEEAEVLLESSQGNLLSNSLAHTWRSERLFEVAPARSENITLLTVVLPGYVLRYLIFTLEKDQARLIAHSNSEALEDLQSITDLVFASPGPGLEESLTRQGRIVALVSQTPKPESPDRPESWIEYTSDAIQALGKMTFAAEPSILDHSLVTPWGPPGLDQLAVFLSPDKEIWQRVRDGRLFRIRLPRVLFQLTELILFRKVLHNLTQRTKSTPIYTHEPVEYVQRLSTEGDRQITIYLNEHLQERTTTLAELSRIARTQKEVCSRVERNIVRRYLTDAHALPPPWRSSHQFGYELIPYLNSRLSSAIDSLSEAKEELEVRQILTSQFLRDRLTAEVAASNLRIQKTLRRLTFLAVGVGLLAAFLGTMPEESKVAIWSWGSTLAEWAIDLLAH
jgi:hypothetical protein